jgi:hypothetical protein
MATPTTGPCYLLELLPPELRLRIYDFAFCHRGEEYGMVLCRRASDDGRLSIGADPHDWIDKTPSKIFPLLGTCRQIYYEALPVFRDRVTFLVLVEGNWKESVLDNGSWARWYLSACMKHISFLIEFRPGSNVDPYLADIKELGSIFQQHGRKPKVVARLRDFGATASRAKGYKEWIEQLAEGLEALTREPSTGDIETAVYAVIAEELEKRYLSRFLRVNRA